MKILESAEKFDSQKKYMSYLVKNIDQFVDDNRRQVHNITNKNFIKNALGEKRLKKLRALVK